MPTTGSPPVPTLLLLTLFLIATVSPSDSLSYTQFQSLHSLMTRVANLRASRGDIAGSDRARLIARKLEPRAGRLAFWGSVWSVGWDYVRNYAWRNAPPSELLGAVSDMNELLRLLNDLTRMESDAGRVEWVRGNYRNALRVSRSLFQRLLKVFHQSGPLREVVETLQKEVVEGDLLRDCLELGKNDLKGLIQIFKDVALQFSSNSDRSDL